MRPDTPLPCAPPHAGALIPATFPDARGAALSALLFGLLHKSGGRNLAFAAWASAVGGLYGGVYLYTSNIWVPAGAHVLANLASAVVWKASQPGATPAAPASPPPASLPGAVGAAGGSKARGDSSSEAGSKL